MGENFNVHNFMFLDEKGNKHILENAKITSITQEGNYENFIDVPREKLVENISFSIDIQTINISKKRFKKLLMSKGIGKNGAEELCKYFHRKNGSYNELYLMYF